jgi:hypothetical protein
MDAVVAVSLMEASMQNSALLQGANVYHTAFPRDPMLSYRSQGITTYSLFIKIIFKSS